MGTPTSASGLTRRERRSVKNISPKLTANSLFPVQKRGTAKDRGKTQLVGEHPTRAIEEKKKLPPHKFKGFPRGHR